MGKGYDIFLKLNFSTASLDDFEDSSSSRVGLEWCRHTFEIICTVTTVPL